MSLLSRLFSRFISETPEVTPKKTLYGLCEYCDKPALFWHKLGVSVCGEHFDMSMDELLALEPQWQEIAEKRHPTIWMSPEDLDTKARFDFEREKILRIDWATKDPDELSRALAEREELLNA